MARAELRTQSKCATTNEKCRNRKLRFRSREVGGSRPVQSCSRHRVPSAEASTKRPDNRPKSGNHPAAFPSRLRPNPRPAQSDGNPPRSNVPGSLDQNHHWGCCFHTLEYRTRRTPSMNRPCPPVPKTEKTKGRSKDGGEAERLGESPEEASRLGVQNSERCRAARKARRIMAPTNFPRRRGAPAL